MIRRINEDISYDDKVARLRLRLSAEDFLKYILSTVDEDYLDEVISRLYRDVFPEPPKQTSGKSSNTKPSSYYTVNYKLVGKITGTSMMGVPWLYKGSVEELMYHVGDVLKQGDAIYKLHGSAHPGAFKRINTDPSTIQELIKALNDASYNIEIVHPNSNRVCTWTYTRI